MQTLNFPIPPIFDGEIPREYLEMLEQSGVFVPNEFDTFRMVLKDPILATPEILSNWFSYRLYKEIDPAEWAILHGDFYKAYKNPFTDDPSAGILYEFRLGAVQVTFKKGEQFIVLNEKLEWMFYLRDTNIPVLIPNTTNALQPRLYNGTDVRAAATIDGALRSFLGIEFAMDMGIALRLAQYIRTSPIGSDNPFVQGEASSLVAIINREQQFMGLSDFNRELATNIASVVKMIYEGLATFTDLADLVKDNNEAAIEIVINRLWVLERMYSYEGKNLNLEAEEWLKGRVTREFFTQCLASKLLGSSPEQLVVSSEDFGPFYNRRNHYGFMIPGDFDVSEMPSDSFGGLLGVKGSQGEIEFRFDMTQHSMAYLTKEDIDVALVLAFGYNKPILPSLSMDNLDNRTPYLAEKVWDPEWLGRTAFGKTLYATDYWMGRLCFNKGCELNLIEITSHYSKAAAEIFFGLHNVQSGKAFLNLRPLQIEWLWEISGDQQEYRCTIKKVGMGVFSKKEKFDFGKKQYVNEWGDEDSGYDQIFNERYDDIAAMWPIFERQRHLVALTRSLTELRERGFEPSLVLADRISKLKETFIAQPALKFQDRLVLWM